MDYKSGVLGLHSNYKQPWLNDNWLTWLHRATLDDIQHRHTRT